LYPIKIVNSEQRLKDYLKLFIKDSGVRGVEDFIKRSLEVQTFIDSSGIPNKYISSIDNFTNWTTEPLNIAKVKFK
jgi:hypothetical protein